MRPGPGTAIGASCISVGNALLIGLGGVEGTCIDAQGILLYASAVQPVDADDVGTAASPEFTVVDDDRTALAGDLNRRLGTDVGQAVFNHAFLGVVCEHTFNIIPVI